MIHIPPSGTDEEHRALTHQKKTRSYPMLRKTSGRDHSASYELIGEEPLLIRVEDKPYALVMRTPGDERFHAAGFCLGEGLADSPEDFRTIGYDPYMDPNVIDIWLKRRRRRQVRALLRQKGFISHTSCGICGKEMINDLVRRIFPLEDSFTVDLGSLRDRIPKLSRSQQYYQKTRGSHAALIFNSGLDVASFAEDVGRHNALDKAIGKSFMENTLDKARLLILSSRISFEMIQKSARARLPIVISESRPTALAVEMGKALNMTLAFTDEKSELVIVCGDHRIRDKAKK
jgi:FdhD protein